jgi:hypothetical protein
MCSMGTIFRCRQWCVVLFIGLALGLGCERSQPDQPADSVPPAAGQKIPFHDGSDQNAAADTQMSPVSASAPGPNAVPFRSFPASTVATGTLVTVRLQHTLSSTRIHPGDTFTAVLAAPLGFEGDILIDRGALVTVRVESARSQRFRPGSFPSSGYIRLSLTAINVEGKQLPLQTSSLFTRGLLQRPNGVQIPKGRDLTFRLTAPLALDQSEAVASHQTGSPNTD